MLTVCDGENNNQPIEVAVGGCVEMVTAKSNQKSIRQKVFVVNRIAFTYLERNTTKV